MKFNCIGKYWNCFGDKFILFMCLVDLMLVFVKSENDFEVFFFKYEVWDMFNRLKMFLFDYKCDNCGGFIISKIEFYKFVWKWD